MKVDASQFPFKVIFGLLLKLGNFFMFSEMAFCQVAYPVGHEITQGEFRLYALNKSTKAFLYHVDSNEKKQRWVNSLNEDQDKITQIIHDKDLVYAKEMRDPQGNRYLIVPVQRTGSSAESKDFFIIPEKQNGNSMSARENYKVVLPGEKKMGALISHREDSFVYLDKSAQETYPLMAEPGSQKSKHCQKNLEGNSECRGWPSSSDQLKVIKSQWIEELDPKTHRKTFSLQYFAEAKYMRPTCDINESKENNSKKGNNIQCPFKKYHVSGWIPAVEVGDTKRNNNESLDVIAYSANYVEKLKSKTQQAGCDQKIQSIPQLKAHTEILDHVTSLDVEPNEFGKCLGGSYAHDIKNKYNEIVTAKVSPQGASSREHAAREIDPEVDSHRAQEIKKGLNDLWVNKYQNGENTPFDQFVRKHWEAQIKSSDQKERLKFEKMMAIDSLARSLYGEMRGSAKDSSVYLKATARVVMNRAALLKKEGSAVRNFISEKSLKEIGDLNKASIFKILPHVLSAPKQVSSWNPDDPNLNVNLCPQPKSEAEKIAWKMALNVATEAVNDTPKFLNDTNCVPYLYYTSNSIPAWAGQLQQVTSQSFTNKECTKFAANKRFLMLWDETALTEKIKKEISPQQNKFYSKNDYLSEF